jgi:hypothetical protein
MEQAVAVIRAALDLGVGLIDTARVYSDSEEKIGAALRGRPERPVVVTKTYERGSEGARCDVDRSLHKLGLSRVPLYLLHNIDSPETLDEVMGLGGALHGLRRALREGLVGSIGISSHKPEIIEEALRRDAFDAVEVPFSAVEKQFLPAIEQAAERNVGTLVMKPLAGGALRQASSALRYVLSHPVSCVVPGMQSEAEVRENLAVQGPLSEEDWQALLKEAEQWRGRFCQRCEYCMPACPNDIKIPAILLFASYSARYGLKEWARERYASLAVQADACEDCAQCEERCPYDLPVRDMLEEAHAELTP